MIKTYEVEEELAGLVPLAGEAEQIVLTNEIREEGSLLIPIVLWRGKIVDGRCRQKACESLGIEMDIHELDPDLSWDQVAKKVKGYNSRRNLTPTQKVMSACRESLRKGNRMSIVAIAKSWGIGDKTLKNARYIAKQRPEFIDPLFNGKSVVITNADGEEVDSNKVTTIYAALKRDEEKIVVDTTYAWCEDTYIKTQTGKEWYYTQLKKVGPVNDATQMLIAELANYKFVNKKKEV